MFNYLNPVLQYKITKKYTIVLILICAALVAFHIFAFSSPFLGIETIKNNSEHLLKVSNTISGITSAIILTLLIVLGYNSLHDYSQKARKNLYASIQNQIEEWFKEANFINIERYIIVKDPS